MAPVVRFAPSPTGFLHIGNARPALFNALFARRTGGQFWLRLDDTDTARSTPEFAAAIEEDLRWLGIVPDGTFRQSERLAVYDAAAERLKAAGRLYPAYETPDELERRRRRQLGRGLPPVYDRAALKLTPEEKAALEAELAELEGPKRQAIIEAIAHARGFGDRGAELVAGAREVPDAVRDDEVEVGQVVAIENDPLGSVRLRVAG